MADGEPLWTHEDRMWALAHDHIEQDRCTGCGHPRSESTDKTADDQYRGHTVRCHACKAQAWAAEAVDDKSGLLAWAERDDL